MAGWSLQAHPRLRSDVFLSWFDWGTTSQFRVERVDARRRRVSGAVYSNGSLVLDSQRRSGLGGDLIENGDESQLDVPEVLPRYHGEWLYGGHWMTQFGHFITETLTGLWPPPQRFRGVVYHPFIFGKEILPWQEFLLDRAGWAGRCVIVSEPAAFEKLAVPRRAFDLNGSVSTTAVEVWARVAYKSELSDLIFLSRSRLSDNHRALADDVSLDDSIRDLGFEVVHPQELSIEDQLRTVARSRLLVGTAGSALHLSAFASKATPVIEIGDRRSPMKPLANQVAIDQAIGRAYAFVPLIAGEGGRDVSATTSALAHLVATVPHSGP